MSEDIENLLISCKRQVLSWFLQPLKLGSKCITVCSVGWSIANYPVSSYKFLKQNIEVFWKNLSSCEISWRFILFLQQSVSIHPHTHIILWPLRPRRLGWILVSSRQACVSTHLSQASSKNKLPPRTSFLQARWSRTLNILMY